MKLSLFTASLLLAGSLYASEHHAATSLSPTQEGMNYVKLLGKTLKTQLKEKLQLDSNGTAAITFCMNEAQNITKEVNEKLPDYAKVRRTSLNLRNQDNKPDETDIKVMKNYQRAIKKKESTAMIMQKVMVGDTIRIYKPLVAGGVCLKCHGENISPEIASAIQASYPEDNASNMKEGDFRGVIVAEIKNP